MVLGAALVESDLITRTMVASIMNPGTTDL
jgi:hypothetical protein